MWINAEIHKLRFLDLEIDLANYRSWSFISNKSIIICAELLLLADLHPCQRSQLPSIGVTTGVLWPKPAWWMSLRRRWDLVVAQSLSLLLCYVSYTLLFLNLQFAALTVPKPVDTQTAKIDSQEQEAVSLSSYFSESFSVLWFKRAHQRYPFSFKYTYIW